MPVLLRNVLAVIAGIVIGTIVNMALVLLGPMIIPIPLGVDLSNPENISAAINLFEPKHFIMPFLAHALGTLAGALSAYLIAARHKALFAYVIGGLFLVGGIMASLQIPSPTWFILLDLIGAYIPMAWLATRIGAKMQPREPDVRVGQA